jgi:hypothetical protein
MIANNIYRIGISGPIGSGKSTLARKLIEKSTVGNIHLIPFAYGVKKLASFEFEPDRANKMVKFLMQNGVDKYAALVATSCIVMYMQNNPSTEGIKNRHLLQYIGHDVGRVLLGDDIWVHIATNYAHELVDTTKPAIIIADDVRYQNEVNCSHLHIQLVPDKTGVYSQRVNNLMKQYGADYVFNSHASEQSVLTDGDVVLPTDYDDALLSGLIDQVLCK